MWRIPLAGLVMMMAAGGVSCGPFEDVADACAGVQCGPCPPALTVKLTAPGGGPIKGVTVEGEQADCHNDTHATFCSLGRNQAGAYRFTVSAPGYQPLTLNETVPELDSPGCCACGYDAQLVEHTLERT